MNRGSLLWMEELFELGVMSSESSFDVAQLSLNSFSVGRQFRLEDLPLFTTLLLFDVVEV